MYLASQHGHLDILRFLVQEAAGSTRMKSFDGMSVLHAAAQMNYLPCVKWLVSSNKGRYFLKRKEGNVLFNDALNTFYLRLYGRKEGNVLFNNALNTLYYGYMEGRKEMFYLMMHSTHFIYGYMVSDIW